MKTSHKLILAVIVMLVGGLAGALTARALAPDFVDEVVISGLSAPTNVEFAPDGRVFITEKRGRVIVYDSLSDPSPDVFADLRSNVHDFWDRGMLGLAIHPDFPSTPYIYVLYTYDAPIGGSPPTWGDACSDPPGSTDDGCVVSGRLSRLEASGNQMTGSEVVLIEDWCQQYPSHSIGDLEFGADGALYVSAGDGASFSWVDYGQGGGDAGSPTPENPCGDPPVPVDGNQVPPDAEGGALRAQDILTPDDPLSLDGTVLRIDPLTGDALPDNPLYGDSDPNVERTVAHGLRNPFRIAFKPGTDDLYIGDVGWGTWEEVNEHPDPTATVRNFGWPCYEGGSGSSLKQPSYDAAGLTMCEDLYSAGSVDDSLFAYRHDEDISGSDPCPPANPPQGTSSSIAGLAFYEGGGYPGTYVGALFGADYSRDCIWVMFPDGSGDLDPSTVEVFEHAAANPVDLEAGPGGDIFYVDINGGGIHRLRFVGNNTPPNAVISADPTSGTAPLTVTFDGSGSSDADEDALSFAWDLDDDGQYDDATGANAEWSYDPGTHTARLLVTDARGESATDSVTIQASNSPPVPVIDTPSSALLWHVGETVGFAGHADDPNEGVLPAEALEWELILHHCEDDGSCHIHDIQVFDGVASGDFVGPDHEYPSYLELVLTATDQHGASAATSLQLDPETVDLTFETDPSGLTLAFAGEADVTPFTETVIVNSVFTVGATSPQANGGETWHFVSWSDGGDRSHEITASTTDQTFTATFNAPPTIVAGAGHDVSENTTFVVDVEAGDSNDGEGSGLVYSISSGADQSDFDVDPVTGEVSFDSAPDYEDPADSDLDNLYEVEVTVADSGGLTDSVVLSVSVVDVNESPVAVDDQYEVDQDTVLSVNGVLDNDSDPEGDALEATLLSDVSDGTLVLALDGSFTYTPDPGWSGSDGFSYQACDPTLKCASADATITVDPIGSGGGGSGGGGSGGGGGSLGGGGETEVLDLSLVSFSDISGNIHEANILAIAEAGITLGCDPENGLYCPRRSVTRAEMTAFLGRAMGLEVGQYTESAGAFSDVKAGSWYAPYVNALADLGIVEGYPDGTFRPDLEITRAEMAVFLIRVFGPSSIGTPIGIFADVPLAAYYAGYVEELYAIGTTRGCASDPLTYCPLQEVFRDEMASFVARSLGLGN